MAEVIYKLAGTVVQPPINGKSVEIELNYDTEDPDAVQVQVGNSWDFEKLSTAVINQHIANGLTGGVGILEGIPWQVYIKDDVSQLLVLDSYLDTADSGSEYECDRAELTSKIRGGNDWLNDRSVNIRYDIMKTLGKIPTADEIQIPYIISAIPDYKAAAIMVLTGYAALSEIRNMTNKVLKVAADLAGVFSAIAGLIKIIILVLYIIVTFIALIKMILEIKNMLIQPVKYHVGMRWQRLLELGAGELGKSFVSTVFDEKKYEDTIIIPAKYKTIEDVKIPLLKGFTSPQNDGNGYYQGSFRDLLATSKQIINGKFNSTDGELKMERRDKNDSSATYTLPDVELRRFRTNMGEFISNHSVRFKTDLSETNTIDQYEGTETVRTTQPQTVTNKDMVLMKGFKDTAIPFALAKRKETLTGIEKVFSVLFKIFAAVANAVIKAVNAVIKVRNKIIKKLKKLAKKLKTFGIRFKIKAEPIPLIQAITFNPLENRIGMMILSNDYFEVPKIASFDITSDPKLTKLKSDNDQIWNSETIYNEFHAIDSFTPNEKKGLKGNQWVRYSIEVAGLCKEDIVKLINNNFIFTHDGRTAKLESLRWNTYTEAAEMDIRIHQLLTDNLIDTITTPDGS